jgi:hypothetical protein
VRCPIRTQKDVLGGAGICQRMCTLLI